MFRRYGREWYEKRAEAERHRKHGQRIFYDFGLEAYYIVKGEKRNLFGF